VIGLTIATLVLLVLRSLVSPSRDSSPSTDNDKWSDVDEKLVRFQRQIVEELKDASVAGEDINGNRQLDAGEDKNGNGRLDSDWRVTAASITFNRVLADGQVTLPITYRQSGTGIERIVMNNTAGSRSRALVAHGVVAFAVAQNGSSVALSALFEATTRGGKTIQRQKIFEVRTRA
jgi:hypothetical protein